MPALYMIAGPNGAGKSTFSKDFVPEGVTVFDGDKELLQLQKKFTDIDASSLLAYVNITLFTDKKEAAIIEGHDFAFETNFATPLVMETVNHFKQNGYDTNLLFIGLSSVNDAIDRVYFRVKEGGHNVSIQDIQSNYTDGLKNLKVYANEFDRVVVYDNTPVNEISTLRNVFKFTNNKLIEKSHSIPAWAADIFSIKKEKSRKKGKRL